MKTIINILFILVTPFSITAQTQNELIEKASKLYTEKNYKEAIATYTEITTSDLEAAEIYYNMGNAHYKLNEIPKAILNYERALLLAPNNKDTKYNLALANSRIVDNIKEVPQLFIVQWGKHILKLFTTNTWAIISLITFTLTLTLIALFLFSLNNKIKKIAFFTGILLLLSSILSFIFSYQQLQLLKERNTAIITSPVITVTSEPQENSTELFLLHEGIKVKIIDDELNGWKKIQISDGNEGWIPNTHLEII